MDVADTRERLLDAAEHLFARHGIGSTSLRAITSEAGANLASIHYHFGSKEALIEAVIARRLDPLNRERFQMLQAVETASGDDPPDLESVVEAFVAPALRLLRDPAHGGSDFVCLMAQLHAEPDELELSVMDLFEDVIHRFTDALGRALPHLPAAEILWRFAFMVGSMAFTLGHTETLKAKSHGLCDPSDVEGATRRLVGFVAAGMRAPVPDLTGEIP